MYRGNKTKKISFRVTDTYYNAIYNSYKNYILLNNKYITFSDYMRNICLSTIVKENANKSYN